METVVAVGVVGLVALTLVSILAYLQYQTRRRLRIALQPNVAYVCNPVFGVRFPVRILVKGPSHILDFSGLA